MKKIALSFLAAISFSASAEAADKMKVTLGGYIDTQFGMVQQRKPFNQFDVLDSSKGKMQNYGIANDTKVDIKIDAESPHGFKYGGMIRINADTSINTAGNDDTVADKTMIYVESKFGRIEGGAYDSASRQMQITAHSIAAMPGGTDGYAPKWINKKMIDGSSYSAHFIKWPELMTNCDCASFGNKITYFTPKISGFQAGVSFTPDIAVHGTVNKLASTPKAEDQNFKDIFDLGIQYENKFKDFGYKIGATAQHAKSKYLNTPRKDLNVYEVGAIVTYKDASIAGSYSDWGKSATPVVKDPNKKYGAKYWTLGAAYKYDKLKSSLTFFKSYRANVFSANVPTTTASHDVSHNRNYYVSLGFDYALVPGLTPYAELTHLHFRNADASRGNRANVLLLGSRLTF